MRLIQNCFSYAGTRTYAAWPVWRDSVAGDVKHAPLPKRQRAILWHRARRLERSTHEPGKHGGAVGRIALAVYYVLLFDFMGPDGRLEPAIATIARKAGCCTRSAGTALRRLKALGMLVWQRRCAQDQDADGRFKLRQLSNAYGVPPASQWRGRVIEAPPPPEPGTWGDHPPLPSGLEQAAAAIKEAGTGPSDLLAMLKQDPGDKLAAALAGLGALIPR